MGTFAVIVKNVGFIAMLVEYFQNLILAQFLSYIHHLSIYLHCFLFEVPHSATQNRMYKELFKIVRFDPIPNIDDFFDVIFGFINIPFTANFESLGYESQYFFVNLGS